ncbi:hypothetical protein ACFFQW_27760 [Umezawaea endophytica]|uniref:Lipoprotein n=1 Tax=Umezawaea endophytica TaxID=1654476 RepID=A0A9X2VHB0_9PSEU|nr:hypothetical protein [Umezawaea endophytica]MCS7476635.1 hypothetical protein [Umezawaea endophytica]
MRNAKVLVALAVGLFALVGCGSDDQPFGAGGSSSTASSGPTSPSASGLPPGSATLPSSSVRPPGQSNVPSQPPQSSATPLPGSPTEVPPARVDGTVLPETYKSQVQVGSDGRTLGVIGQAGGCKTASAEVTAESPDQVLITLVTTYYAPNGGVCTQEIRDVPLTVTLASPLAERKIVLESRQDAA